MKFRFVKQFFNLCWNNLELIIWVFALFYLFFISPEASHFSLCPIKNLGFSFCPGCGLGHSAHHAMHLNFETSFSQHPLGAIAVLIIIFRIFKLIFQPLKTIKT